MRVQHEGAIEKSGQETWLSDSHERSFQIRCNPYLTKLMLLVSMSHQAEGVNVMADKFEIGSKVRVKEASSEHSGEQEVILRLGLGREPCWVIQFEHGHEEVLESDLELVAASEI